MSKFFWLYADGKTVKELETLEAFRKQDRRGRHLIIIYDNGDLCTTRKFITAKQLSKMMDLWEQQNKKEESTRK